MPITTPLSLHSIRQKDFAQLDYDVMRQAFECQNQLGRLADELIDQNDLAARLQAAGLTVGKEVPVTVTHRDFAKTYSLDVVVAGAGIYELKTARALVGEHEAPLLNYLFLFCRRRKPGRATGATGAGRSHPGNAALAPAQPGNSILGNGVDGRDCGL